MRFAFLIAFALAACSADEKPTTSDLGFDGTCVNCHAGLSSGHVHANYKLKCVDCHGGNDLADVPEKAFMDPALYRDPARLAVSHVKPKVAGLARFFFANGIDDNGDGTVDEAPRLDATKTQLDVVGEIFEPGLHGEGPGEFVDTELQRDLNYTRFLNPGDLRVATATCGSRSGAGSGTGCHQETVDIVRRSIMVNQSGVINGAYYGNESWRKEFIDARGTQMDPRSGAFAYSLDYEGVDQCITANPTHFDSTCLEARATAQDPAVAAGAPGNVGLPAFEMAQGTIKPAGESQPGVGATQKGAGFTRYPWGGQMDDVAAERAQLAPVPNGVVPGTMIPDPVDVVLRTFRAYYPLNYPGSTINFNNTFGTSIQPEQTRFATNDPFGRGHSSGCSSCHAPYSYDGSRQPTQVTQDDGTTVAVIDPTTKHRELDPATQDRGMINGADHLIGRAVRTAEQDATGRTQQKTYSMAHSMTTKIDTDACGLCHGFVTRINNAYQGFAEEEQRDLLARRAPIAFTTPTGTKVRILDSWVREDTAIASGSTVVIPEGVAIVDLAKKRDAALAKDGFVAGNGGCAQATFTEDCNNNGELDHNLVLTQVDEAGKIIKTVTIDEDLNSNGSLDLIDRLPREKSVDGRQMRYIYGGRNGSTRQMDVHFERGMHCIDCHFLQDVHGDGHVYSTNWDAIEIECEDCHGGKKRSNLTTSGPNGGNLLTTAHDDSGVPFFSFSGSDKGGAIVQRSRVTPGVFWKVPQAIDDTSGLATEAHAKHAADPKEGSTFSGTQGSSPIVTAKLECATCHSSWVHNCMGCHIDLNIGDKQRSTVQADGKTVVPSAAENEVWLSNANNPGHVNFQLLGLLRAPFVLGVTSKAEGGRLATFRSSMQAHVTVTDANGNTAIDNATFTTFQTVDANSGRVNVATSGVAMNQTMPHTVRPKEARGCEMCHSLVGPTGAVRNEHILAETYGLGTGAYAFVGDWAMAAGAGGIELFEHKQEHELAAEKGASNRFPGLIVNPNDRKPALVEPLFDGTVGIGAGAVANDIVLVRNFDPTPAVGQPSIPSFKDLAIVAVDVLGVGKLVISEITARGNPSSVRPSIGDATHGFVLALPAPPLALAHISPDVSDPFVYVADGAAGVNTIELLAAPNASTPAAKLVGTTPIAGKTATAIALAGDMLYVGTAEKTIETFSLADPRNPVFASTLAVPDAVTSLRVAGFILYVGMATGLSAVALEDPGHPAKLAGTSGLVVASVPVRGMAISQGHMYVANASGVFDVDMRTPASPTAPVNLSQQLAPGQTINAVDVVVSVLPGQTWLLVLDANGDLWGLKLDNRKSNKERCFPDTTKCALDMSFLDATIMGRDPSFDPIANAFISPADPNPKIADPSSGTIVGGVVQPFFHMPRLILGGGKRLAPPTQWEQIGTLTGRRMRDSFMPGAGVLSLSVMQAMRAVKVCESTAPSTTPNGLGALGYDNGSGTCTPLGTSANTALKPCASVAAGGCAFHRVSRAR